jgi:hypothetical protein
MPVTVTGLVVVATVRAIDRPIQCRTRRGVEALAVLSARAEWRYEKKADCCGYTDHSFHLFVLTKYARAQAGLFCGWLIEA